MKVTIPARSTRDFTVSCVSPSTVRHRAIASTLTGRLTKKIQRQDTPSVSRPPMIGPTAADAPAHGAPHAVGGAAIASLVVAVEQREGGGEHRGRADPLHGPCGDQGAGGRCHATDEGRRGEQREAGDVGAAVTDPVGDRPGPEHERRERERVGVDDPLQRLKHVLRSPAMSGRATFTIVTSMSSMKVPRQTVISGSHLRMSILSLPLPTSLLRTDGQRSRTIDTGRRFPP